MQECDTHMKWLGQREQLVEHMKCVLLYRLHLMVTYSPQQLRWPEKDRAELSKLFPDNMHTHTEWVQAHAYAETDDD